MDNEFDPPVFVVGSSRSGTTLLYNILLSSGEFPLYEAETMLLDECALKYGDLSRERNYRRFMKDWLVSKQFIRSKLEPEQFLRDAQSHHNSYTEFLGFFMGSMAKNQGKRRWAEKTPTHIRHMAKLSEAFKNAKFIHIIRDGRDVALSRRKLGWNGVRSKDPLKQLLFSALDWAATVEKGRRTGSYLGRNYLEIRYEDLIADVEGALVKLSEFAKVKIDKQSMSNIAMGSLKKANSAFAETTDGISNQAVERWKKSLTDNELECLNIAIGKTLREFGYDVPKSEGTNRFQFYWKIKLMKLLYKLLISLKRIAKQKFFIGRLLPTSLELSQTEKSRSYMTSQP